MTTRNPWEEDTRPNRPNLLRQSLQQEAAQSVAQDDDTRVGMMMRQTVANTNALQALRTEFDVLAREVRQSQRAQPESIRTSAKRASNRMAAIMAALLALYEATSPWIGELIRQLRHR